MTPEEIIEINARIGSLTNQRNAALDHVVVLEGRLALMAEQLKEKQQPEPNHDPDPD